MVPNLATSDETPSCSLARVVPGAKMALEKEATKVPLQTRTDVKSLGCQCLIVPATMRMQAYFLERFQFQGCVGSAISSKSTVYSSRSGSGGGMGLPAPMDNDASSSHISAPRAVSSAIRPLSRDRAISEGKVKTRNREPIRKPIQRSVVIGFLFFLVLVFCLNILKHEKTCGSCGMGDG